MTVQTTFKDQEVLGTMLRLCEENLVPPSVREIQVAMNYKSPHSISVHLENLMKAELIERLPGYRCYMPVIWRQRLRKALELLKGTEAINGTAEIPLS